MHGTARRHLTCCPHPWRSSGSAQASLISSMKWEFLGRPREEKQNVMGCLDGHGYRCQSAGVLAWGSSWRCFVTHGCSMKRISPLGPALSIPGGFIGALYHISALGVVSYIPYVQEGVPSTSTLRGSPNHILLTRMEGWGRGIRGIWRCY